MRILSLKFPKLGIDFWKGVIMTTTGSPIFPEWDELPEDEPLETVSVDRNKNSGGGDEPGDDCAAPPQKIAGSQRKARQRETILR